MGEYFENLSQSAYSYFGKFNGWMLGRIFKLYVIKGGYMESHTNCSSFCLTNIEI